MSTVDRALADSTPLFDELSGAVDARTREILEHRCSTPTVRRRGWLVRRALLSADVFGLALAFACAQAVVANRAGEGLSRQAVYFLVTLPGWIVVANAHGLYDRDEERTDHTTSDDLVGVLQLVTMGTWLFFLGAKLLHFAGPNVTRLIVFWALAIVFVTTARAVARGWCRRQIQYLQNTVIVGAGDIGQLIARKLLHHPEYGINLVGLVDSERTEVREDLGDVSVLGGLDRLPAIVHLFDIERVIVAFERVSDRELVDVVRTLRERSVQVDIVPRLYDVIGTKTAVHTVEGFPLIGLPPARMSRSGRALKRSLDIAGATLALFATAPLFALIAVLIKRDSQGPALFRQTRLGMNMDEFTTLKFRTMKVGTSDAEHRDYVKATMSPAAVPLANGVYKLERATAITGVGRWLRRTSLDELPQLINVLRGEMSLVGPRPCIPYETESFLPHHFERFNVPAGITGLWQVTARAHSTFGEALDLDVAYARGWSLGLDLKLLFKTPVSLLRSKATR
jgi:exopolysaccharide biosynthesis polyprenyl glycosylphosphotransferase